MKPRQGGTCRPGANHDRRERDRQDRNFPIIPGPLSRRPQGDLRYDQPILADENKEPYYPDAGSGLFPEQDADEVLPIKAVFEQVYEGLD